jgi:RimJ/RimL family protein N-acetyltransferase
MSKKEQIIGRRITLRELKKTDLPILSEWTMDPFLAYLVDIKKPLSVDYLKEWVDDLRRDYTKRIFAITLKRTGRNMGIIGISDYTNREHGGHLTMFIGAAADRGKGYAREAMLLFLDHCFNTWNMNRIFLIVDCDNVPAINLYEYCGMSKEGSLVEYEEYKKGDVKKYIMAVRRDEFNEIKQL